MRRRIFTGILALLAVSAMAQSTARKFTLQNSEDGESELTVYLPEASKATGRAIVDCPGGGYSHLSMDNEGHNWAEFYNSKGYAYVVLKYRMPKGDRNIPLSDAYNAIKTVRDSAAVWHVNPRNVGIMGFSAGGHLASAVSTHASMAVRPDFSILFYPVISMNEKETHKGSCVGFLGDNRNDANLQKEWNSAKAVRRHLTPPAILLLANDDRAVPPVTNGVAYYSAMRQAGNSCAMMIYPSGGHGFGFKQDFKYHEQMLEELNTWLDNLKMPEATDIKVACVGNSITDGAGIDMAEALAGYPTVLRKTLGNGYDVKNFGVSGRTALNNGDRPYQKEQSWHDCLDWKPDVVVIKLGTNDTKPQNRDFINKELYGDMQQMIDSLRSANKNVRIIIASPIPAYQDTWGITDSIITAQVIPVLQKLVKKNKLEYIDLHTELSNSKDLIQRDGIHPNEKGAAKMAEIIANKISKH